VSLRIHPVLWNRKASSRMGGACFRLRRTCSSLSTIRTHRYPCSHTLAILGHNTACKTPFLKCPFPKTKTADNYPSSAITMASQYIKLHIIGLSVFVYTLPACDRDVRPFIESVLVEVDLAEILLDLDMRRLNLAMTRYQWSRQGEKRVYIVGFLVGGSRLHPSPNVAGNHNKPYGIHLT
jgi:hypothetical protein